MFPAILGAYALYLAAVAIAGNGRQLLSDIRQDAVPFAFWFGSIVALSLLAENRRTRVLVVPIATLVVLNFVLRNWEMISSEFGIVKRDISSIGVIK